MKIHFKAVAMCAAALLCLAGPIEAQRAVSVGRGSYAEFPPLSKGRTDEHGGDKSTMMQSKRLWVTEKPGRPIPTNDWWTGLINAPFADALWSYPAMVHPSESGVTVNYPTWWNDNGTEVKWHSGIEVSSRDFAPVEAVADDWHDWDVVMLMRDADGAKSMKVTLMHGSPFTWIELGGLSDLQLRCSGDAELFDTSGATLSPTELNSYSHTHIGLRIGDDYYGIYLPSGSALAYSDGMLKVTYTSAAKEWVVVGLLPDASHLAQYAAMALNIPRATTVSWNYDEKRGEIASTWRVDAENLVTGTKDGDVLQGFLPHAYKSATQAPTFDAVTYLTPRGTMKMTRGREFTFKHRFAGMLPWYAHPSDDNHAEHPFRPEVMEVLMRKYAENGTFGNDTYWGGKGLTQMALNMTFALQSGNDELFIMCRDKLKAKLIDWLTYTPGEQSVYFAYYPRWGGLVGEDTSYDSDTFNDHHFHYGYYTLAGAILCMVDDDFKAKYGDMLRLVAKDYVNWDRNDTRFPFLRTMDPWVGHSYAGGLGDQGNSNGNGQESSSEAMQGWGGVYLLGVALDDKEMRDAGIFGWSTEARATREYWFDVDHVTHRDGAEGNYDYTRFLSPYNTNITCKGIGWWTWFSGDPLHMHGIQWMPVSPALDYMSWDRDFVEWAYNDLMNTPGWGHKWMEDGTNPDGGHLSMLANDDWGNVTLAYMQRALPGTAAAIFDEAWEKQLGIATAVSTGHISYYVIHSHLTYGEIDIEVNADIPSANCFVNSAGDRTYVVYNPSVSERDVNFYRNGVLEKTVKAPAGKMTAFTAVPIATAIELTSKEGHRFPLSSQLTAKVADQYGASVDVPRIYWAVDKPTLADVSSEGVVTWSKSTPDGTVVNVYASAANVDNHIELVKGAVPEVRNAHILPLIDLVEKGTPVDFSLEAVDQYGEPYLGQVQWTLDGVDMENPRFESDEVGVHTIGATAGALTTKQRLFVTPALPNIAEGKTAVSSSEENAGTLTASVNDGNTSTRWGSLHRDGEWIYIDLGEDCRLTRVAVNWEAAYASSYLVQTARDGAKTESYTGQYFTGTKTLQVVAEDEWVTAAQVTGVSGAGVKATTINAVGRYLRIKALTRGSAYGVSIYELQVSGVPVNASPTDVVGIDIACNRDYIDENETATFSAVSYLLSGDAVPATVTWSATGGKISSDGVFTPSGYGLAIIKASAGGMSAERSLAVNEVIHLKSLTATPAECRIAQGMRTFYELEALNQFGGIYTLAPGELEIAVADATTGMSADGLRVADGIIKADALGSYNVIFTACGKQAIITVDVVPMTEINLALNKPVTVSSIENEGLAGRFAVDGNEKTRWGSQFLDNQWIVVDLGDIYRVVEIRVTTNDAAYASLSRWEYSADGDVWYSLGDREMNAIGTDILNVDDREMRFFRYTCLKRATGYGTSIAEIEIYGNTTTSVDDIWSPAATVNVYTLDGVLLRSCVPAHEATRGLAPGVYIVGSRKVLVD